MTEAEEMYVIIDWEKIPDRDLKEGMRRLNQLRAKMGWGATRKMLLKIDVLSQERLGRLWCLPNYITVVSKKHFKEEMLS